jgi:Fe-S-cluster containining protein
MKKFACIEGCSECCIKRQYYPSEVFGKIGVLLLPEEREYIEGLASQLGLSIKIMPRLALGEQHEKIIAYQLMGSDENGDLCPFLDLSKDSPHGGSVCRIYAQRPLACKAYPVIDACEGEALLDAHCKFCSVNKTSASTAGLQAELEALAKIKSLVRCHDEETVWRYATGTGSSTQHPEGWIREPND